MASRECLIADGVEAVLGSENTRLETFEVCHMSMVFDA